MRTIGLLLGVLVLGAGCSSISTKSAYMGSDAYQGRPVLNESLFKSDEAQLGSDSIEKILNSRIQLPQKARLAVLRFGQRGSWWLWSEDFASMDHEMGEEFLAGLRQSKRVADVGLLPSLMTPEKQTIPHLREAAARLQADLLLVYRSASYDYQKYGLFVSDRTKAQCIVEAILLDVRTGIVPFTSVAVREYEAKRTSKDYSFDETIMRARLKGEGDALKEVGRDLGTFLDGLP